MVFDGRVAIQICHRAVGVAVVEHRTVVAGENYDGV
jgi:hypothetical protein